MDFVHSDRSPRRRDSKGPGDFDKSTQDALTREVEWFDRREDLLQRWNVRRQGAGGSRATRDGLAESWDGSDAIQTEACRFARSMPLLCAVCTLDISCFLPRSVRIYTLVCGTMDHVSPSPRSMARPDI